MRTVRSKGLVTGFLLTDAHGFFWACGDDACHSNIHSGSSRIRALQTKSSEGKKVNYGVSILIPSRNSDRCTMLLFGKILARTAPLKTGTF